MSGIGHNSGDVIAGAAQGRLMSFLERVERLEEDKAAVAADLKEVFSELKGEGFDPKPFKKLVALRKKDRAKVQEEKAMLELYASALGCEDLV